MELSTHNLVKKYRERAVVDSISLEMRQGEVVGLLGPNGAGKTTTFYMIVGLIRPNSGRVLLDGQDITGLPMYRRARQGISYLPQEASIFRNLTTEQNLLLVLEMQDMPAAERKERVEKLLEELHITEIRKRLGKFLSGGERRRVEIARALAASPKFILLDEPFTGVDPKAIEDIGAIIHRLSERDNIGILITDHNVEAMLNITQRLYIIAGGKRVAEGTSADLVNNPEARDAYFGETFWKTRQELAEWKRRSEWDDDPSGNPPKGAGKAPGRKGRHDDAPDR